MSIAFLIVQHTPRNIVRDRDKMRDLVVCGLYRRQIDLVIEQLPGLAIIAHDHGGWHTIFHRTANHTQAGLILVFSLEETGVFAYDFLSSVTGIFDKRVVDVDQG